MVCSPIKALRELGSDRRKTGRPLSAVSEGILREFASSKNCYIPRELGNETLAQIGEILYDFNSHGPRAIKDNTEGRSN